MAQLITAPELAALLGIPERTANRIMRTVNEQLQREGFITLNTRPIKAPRDKVMGALGLKGETK
jgi:hypothetical protein